MPEARIPLTACPLCEGASFQAMPKYEKDHLARCRSCGFVFSAMAPSDADYEAIYGQGYDYVAEDAAQTEQNRLNERAVAESLAPFRKNGKVLDVAAGAGRLLLQFKALGFDVHATEFDDKGLAYLRDKGIEAHGGGLTPDFPPDASFDIVVLTEVIEHINNPRSVIAGLVPHLRPGGVLYLTTPNFDSLERRMIGPDWGMIMFPEHITYWSPRHIDRLLREMGMRKVSLRTEGISPFRIVQSLRKKGVASGLSENAISDKAQAAVSKGPLRRVKQLVNGGLVATGLGSGIRAIYQRPD